MLSKSAIEKGKRLGKLKKYNKSIMSSYTRQQLETWLGKIDVQTENVLDIGGAQNPVKGRTRSWNVKNYKILDLAEPHIRVAEPDIVFDLNNDDILDSRMARWRKYFDIVFCLEVSEYWFNPMRAVRVVESFLKKGGLLYISFHFFYPAHSPVGKDYLRYTREGAIKILEKAGFEVIDITPRHFKMMTIKKWGEVIKNENMRPSKNYKFHFESGVLVIAKK